MKYLFSRILILFLLSSSFTTLRAQPSVKWADDTRIDPSRFMIFPWDSMTGGQAKYDELYECGFNMAGFVASDSLDLVEAAGLKCFIRDPRIQIRGGETFSDDEVSSRVRAVVASTRSHPTVIGYHLLDEPAREFLKEVGRWSKAFHAEAPEKIAYVNLFPDYGQHEARVTTDAYHSYMEAFVEQVKPQVLSYDHYALFQDGRLRDSYFPNLETGRAISLKTGLPLIQVILGNAHFDYAEPSPEWFRFQIYTSLAYGVRGIGWFTYTDRDRGNYRSAAIGLDGSRSPTWKMMRDVNLVCHRLAPTLVRMQSVGVFHHPNPPKGCLGIVESKFLKEVRGNGPFLVGEFEGENSSRGVLIVNKSLTRSTRFTIVPKDDGSGRKFIFNKVSAITGKVAPMTAENDWLAPGQGMLLLLDYKEVAQ